MTPRLWNTTALAIKGATPMHIAPRTAWTDGHSLNGDRIRRYAATIPAVEHAILDLEVPALMELDARKPGVTLTTVSRGIATGIWIIEQIHAERPELKLAWYDSDIEDATTIHYATESRIRRSRPRGDGLDGYYADPQRLPDALVALDRLEWASSLLADLRKAEGFAMRRVYSPFGAKAWEREGVIQYQWRQAVADANGEKMAALLFWPVNKSGAKRSDYTSDDIASAFAVMCTAGVGNVVLWRDGLEKVTTLKKLPSLALKRAAQEMAETAVES